MGIYVGTRLYGYLNGHFDGEHGGSYRIEAVGVDWLVIRNHEGVPQFQRFDSTEVMEKMVVKWSNPERED